MSSSTYKCGMCNKDRNAARFSASSISKYQASLRTSRRTGAYVKNPVCQYCSTGTRHELECAKCGIVKSLDAFSKQQRKNAENAECIICVQERQDREADHAVETEEQRIIEEYRNGITPAMRDSTRSALMSHGLPSHGLSNVRGLSNFSEAAEDAWIQPPVEVPDDPRDRTNEAAYDVNIAVSRLSIHSDPLPANQRLRENAALTGIGWEKFSASSGNYRSQYQGSDFEKGYAGSNVSKGANQGFAKQRAVPQDINTKAHVQFQREERRKQEQQEQEAVKGSDDDDDEDDSDTSSVDPY